MATSDFAGVERYITYVAPGLTAAGWRVTVLGGEPHRMASLLASSGATHLPHRSSVSTVTALRRLEPDLVHAHMTVAETLALLGTGRHTPIVATRHFTTPRGSTPPARLFGRVIRRRLAAEIAISEFVAAEIHEPSIIVPNGVPGNEQGRHRSRTVLVCHRLESEKETAVAIDAWALSGLGEQGWVLQIAGDGSEAADLEALAQAHGVSDSVEFLGFVDDAAARMADAGMFLATAPSEPFGLSVAEAMSTGALVIAARGGGHLELLAGSDRQMFEPGDSADCARVLREWSERSLDERIRVGEASRTRQRADFSIETHLGRLLAVYRSALGITGRS